MAASNNSPESSGKLTGIKFVFRALRHRNYRLFFAGQGLSLIGTWMTIISTSWLVYRLTNSVFLLGIVGFACQIPAFLLAPFAGVFADRWSRQRLLVITQLLAMLQSFSLAVLALTGIINIWHVILLNIFQGVINAFDMPARQSFVVDMVENKDDLVNAIALNSSLFNGARLIGPSIAGLLIAAVGEGMCFLIDGISYIAVILALLAMEITPGKKRTQKSHLLSELKEGFTYVFDFVPVRSLILLLALVSLMGMPYTVLMPVVAKEVLHGGPHTLGFLMGAAGLGALTGAIYLASRKNVLGLGRIIVISTCIFGTGLITFAFSYFLWLSLILILLTGFGAIVQMASSNTILQTIVEDDKRARVMSFYTMAFMGMLPLGSLLAGMLASRVGVQNTLAIGGTCIILGAVMFAINLPAMRKIVRPIYMKMNIIQETGNGIHMEREGENKQANQE